MLYELAGQLKVSAADVDSPPIPGGRSGRILEVSAACQAQGQHTISAQSIALATMPASMSSGASAQAALLCRADDLKLKIAEVATSSWQHKFLARLEQARTQ